MSNDDAVAHIGVSAGGWWMVPRVRRRRGDLVLEIALLRHAPARRQKQASSGRLDAR